MLDFGTTSEDLEQLFAKLRRNDLVNSVRGPGGGYRLSRGGHDIFVAQIIDDPDITLQQIYQQVVDVLP